MLVRGHDLTKYPHLESESPACHEEYCNPTPLDPRKHSNIAICSVCVGEERDGAAMQLMEVCGFVQSAYSRVESPRPGGCFVCVGSGPGDAPHRTSGPAAVDTHCLNLPAPLRWGPVAGD